ncbi:ABC transporter substrate-binding protein [Corynebacterium sp. 32222D000AT]|uniref:ABC transporter substrate-binding protein n=1 Tax=unclassified Corynebacterium TaxID=2624378 RepID=UPI002A97E7C6|nr:ABC transporter substrate-binding protein [Mycobacteriaceae bacterium]MDY5828629.1 ABC transporter substrate-binding protein [Corynebacterium sp.]
MGSGVNKNPTRWRLAAAGLAASLALGLAACGQGEEPAEEEGTASSDHFGYQTSSELVTTNAGTAFGSAGSVAQLSSRLYPAAFVPGPRGQMIPNTDLVQAQELNPGSEDESKSVLYTLSDDAKFSDGQPVTCVDYLLAYTAGTMQETFGSHMPLAQDIQQFKCAPENKVFEVVFAPGTGQRWRGLFGPGTVMPAHAIAKKLGMDSQELTNALYSQDPTVLEEVARIWRFDFQLAEFDPELQVSFGPYVIDHVGESGEVVLERNPHFFGNEAEIAPVTVWPADADSGALKDAGTLGVVDSRAANPAWLDRDAADNPYEIEPVVGDLTESLVLSEYGLFAQEEPRRAFSECIDQAALAKLSSAESGVEVPPVYQHVLRHNDPIGKYLKRAVEPHVGTDNAIAQTLSGQTIRIGYLGPNDRYAAMVEKISETCQPAGITVEDVSAENTSQYMLNPDPETGLPAIDAFLGPIDPLTEFSTAEPRISNVEELNKAEAEQWQTVRTIPLAAQPKTFVVRNDVKHVVPYTGLAGIGWNMDRWALIPEGATESKSKDN